MFRISCLYPYERFLSKNHLKHSTDVLKRLPFIRKTRWLPLLEENPFSRTCKRNFDSLRKNFHLQTGVCPYKSIFSKTVPSFQVSSSCHPLQIHLSPNDAQEKSKENVLKPDNEENMTLFQKLKAMYTRYWYVLIPVHSVTSIVWYGSFFYAAKNGIDLVPYLEMMHVPEKFLYYLRDSNAGYFAIAYGFYKVATPARYTVTLTGTTIAINYLRKHGYIKPVPTKDELKTMYEERKEQFMDKGEEMKERYEERKAEFKHFYSDKKDEFMDKYPGLKSKDDDPSPEDKKPKEPKR